MIATAASAQVNANFGLAGDLITDHRRAKFALKSEITIWSLGRLPVGLGSSNKMTCHTTEEVENEVGREREEEKKKGPPFHQIAGTRKGGTFNGPKVGP